MKAIHNSISLYQQKRKVVYDPAKVAKMKAIHNARAAKTWASMVVYDPAKVAKMKAIHNKPWSGMIRQELFMTLQR